MWAILPMIRARDITESIQTLQLNERNVVNIPHLEKYIEEFVKNTDVPEIKQWLRKNFRLYLINEFPDVLPFDADVEPDSPYYQSWLKDALKRGEKVYLVTPDIHAAQVFNHVLDYLNFAFESSDELPRELQIKKLSALSYDEVYDRTLEWDSWLQGRKGDEGGTEDVMDVGGGYKWVQVLSWSALDYEGSQMGHCVGSYAAQVEKNHCQIFSLRDPRNEPHVTIEARGNEIVQIKGKQNTEVIAKYRGYCLEFLNSGRFNVNRIGELENIHAENFRGELYDVDELPPAWWEGIGWERLWQKFPHRIKVDTFPSEVESAIEKGSDVNFFIVRDFGVPQTAVMIVCGYNAVSAYPRPELEEDLLDILFRHGAKVNLQDASGDTALNMAVFYASEGTIDYLLKKGADPTLVDKHGAGVLERIGPNNIKHLLPLLRAGAVTRNPKTRSYLTKLVKEWLSKKSDSDLRDEILDYLEQA
jgi:hypothetical protein